MNYLAHAYLSFDDASILVGNMISDFVKGRRKYDLPESIQRGIEIHRRIDTFTDQHLANRELKLIFKPHYGLYSSAIMDVLFDHFLATDEEIFDDASLMEFSLRTYEYLDPYQHLFPEKFARMYPWMKSQNWLYNYQFREGIRSSLGGLARRALYMPDPAKAYSLFEEHYKTLRAGYGEFFPELVEMTRAS